MQHQHTEERRNIRSKIPENKKLANQLENFRKLKHHSYLQNRIEIQGNTSKDTSMESVINAKIATKSLQLKNTKQNLPDTKQNRNSRDK